MEDKKLTGSKKSLQSMLFYHLIALDEQYADPKGELVKEIADMITLSEDQVKYVKMGISNNAGFDDQLEMASKLVEGMIKTKKIDMESLNIIKGLLDTTIQQVRETVKSYNIKKE